MYKGSQKFEEPAVKKKKLGDKCKKTEESSTAEDLDKIQEAIFSDEIDVMDSDDEDAEISNGLTKEELERILEEGLPEEMKSAPEPEKSYIEVPKIVLEEKGVNHLEELPPDWVMVPHKTGILVYYHWMTKVCTLSKPYLLDKDSARRHQIPISAIPCMSYKKALEEEEKEKKRVPEELPGGLKMAPPKVETASQLLSHEQLSQYCRRLFKFKVVNQKRFLNWGDRHKHYRTLKKPQCPTLAKDINVTTLPDQALGVITGNAGNNKWTLNLNKQSTLFVFHQYVRKMLQKLPEYEYKQLENPSPSYQATAFIDGVQYGVGQGPSKRLAKAEAARGSLIILIPAVKDILDRPEEPDISYFDQVPIEDSRVTNWHTTTSELSPHAILRTCLLRKFGPGGANINMKAKVLGHKKLQLTMKVGEIEATVVCEDKSTAKQRAAQSILQMLNPNVQSWGSLLRMYGTSSAKKNKEKLEAKEITQLAKMCEQGPNFALLEKLRSEMVKLKEFDAALASIGTFMVHQDFTDDFHF